jgi:anaerobic selenocysteine-containing dehydrogenase
MWKLYLNCPLKRGDLMSNKRVSFAKQLLGQTIDRNFRSDIPRELIKDQETDCGSKGVTRDDAAGADFKDRKPPKGVKVVKSACFSCNSNCEVLVFVDEKSGEILKVEGDPESPITKGMLCAKGLAARDLVYNPERIGYPLKRVGKRGEGKWERISWDEALSTTAEKLLEYKEKYGPLGIAFLQGTRRGWSRVYSRLANAFGVVNHGAAGWAQCLWPRLADNKSTFGANYMETADFENTRCILIWGTNPPATWPVIGANIMDARQRGAAIIVVDPYLCETAAKADIWLQVRPGTDIALALSMMHIIIKDNLYDKDFVQNWTVGFEELKKHVEGCTPEWADGITGVPAELIRKAARLYAGTKPACVQRCVALEEVHDSVQACRAVSMLAAITGNIGIPGGNNLVSNRGVRSQDTHEFIKADLIGPELEVLRRGFDEFPLLCSKFSPTPCAHMPTLWNTIASGEPYPVKAALIFGSNALISHTNINRVREAFDQLEFIVVSDLFMTPTAAMADIVLPSASWLERDNVISSFQASPTYTFVQQKVITYKEARSDVEIICQLAEKLGLGQYFWKDAEELYDYLLEPVGLTLDGFKKQKRIYAPIEYRQYEKTGFNTPSGKVELYSSIQEKYNCDPIPTYTEPFESPVSTPQLAREYPLILTTGGRVPVFRHSENRQNPLLREICPRSEFRINPATASEYGIENGDRVVIETRVGATAGYALLTEGIDIGVVLATPGWAGDDNINLVIPWGKYAQGMGTVPMRGLLCRIRKATEQQHTAGDERRESNE